MIISRTPLRMSFVGGGSDLPSYYREYGGAVVSTAIDKYVYVTMNRKFDSGIRVAYSRVEEVNSVSEIEHQLVRAALNMAGVPGGVEITTVADIPSRGTGLGSSSSFTVALLHALYALLGRHSPGAGGTSLPRRNRRLRRTDRQAGPVCRSIWRLRSLRIQSKRHGDRLAGHLQAGDHRRNPETDAGPLYRDNERRLDNSQAAISGAGDQCR